MEHVLIQWSQLFSRACVYYQWVLKLSHSHRKKNKYKQIVIIHQLSITLFLRESFKQKKNIIFQ